MDRRAHMLPRWLALAILGLAVLPETAARVAASSPPDSAPSVKIVPSAARHGETAPARESPSRASLGAGPGAGRLSPPGNRISMVVGPTFPSVQDPPQAPPGHPEPQSATAADGSVTINLHEPVSVPGANGASAAAPPEVRARPELPATSRREQMTRETRMSVIVEPAAEPATHSELPSVSPSEGTPTEPFTPPEPDWIPETPARGADGPAQPPTRPSVRPEPDHLPEMPLLRGAGAAADPAARRTAASVPGGMESLQRRPASLLCPPEAAKERSEQLERIAQQADRQIRRGFELAGRGAYFAARSEFIKALRLLAEGLDTEHQTEAHSRSLALALAAMSEAADFIPAGSRLEGDLKLRAIIEGHRTPVLKNAATENLTPLSALKCYFTFAQEQLAAAAGSEVAGSMALCALGKLHAALAGPHENNVRAAEAKAVAFYQAALLVYPQNYMAANDLGVLLARCGDYREAEGALKYSLSIHPQSTSWHNLAVVYRQQGQPASARQALWRWQAATEAEIARRKALRNPPNESVRWVDPSVFNQLQARTPVAVPRTTPPAKPADATPPRQSSQRREVFHGPPGGQTEQRSILGWLPWSTQGKRN
jgi:tetratricopeptide (TPR) repeat protein